MAELLLSDAQLAPALREIIRMGGTVELTVTGNSMNPLLHHRVSKVRLGRADALHRGDVPLYCRSDGHCVLHRIVRCKNGLVLCGDAQQRFEYGISAENVLGVMTDFTWHGRWVSCRSLGYGIYWRAWTAPKVLLHGCRRALGKLRRLIRA